MMSMLRRCIAVSWGMTARVNGSRAGGGPAPCARGGCLLPLVPGQRVLDVFQPLDRKSVVEGKGVSVRVDLGGRRILKKKNTKQQHIITMSVYTIESSYS